MTVLLFKWKHTYRNESPNSGDLVFDYQPGG
jgi:hypothetical protein